MYKLWKIMKFQFLYLNILKSLSKILLIILLLSGCNGKFPGADAREFPEDPKLRVKKNLEEGRGFRFSDATGNKGTTYDFASSNELWRASLDIIDFMPLASVNYSGGIIITDWYSNDQSQGESIKISIRFLTNEVRSDALDIKVFTRKCEGNLNNCVFTESTTLIPELTKQILKKAAIYEKQKKDKDFKPYKNQGLGIE